MDRMIYTAMTGARHILEQQANVAHNLANASTAGFKAQVDVFRAVPIDGPGIDTRVMVVDATAGTDFSPGSIQHTGRDLDVALEGKGFIAVQRKDGSEAYTRHGDLKFNENGILITSSGLQVIGDAGPITIPPDVRLTIGKDGTISAVPHGSKLNSLIVVGRIKLVNPPEENIVRSDDGLFQTKDGNPADADVTARLIGGALEQSNVNVVDAMVSMISLSRQFEMQMKLLQNGQDNANRAASILSLS